MNASWASQYSSLSELARDADAIVVGLVKGVANRSTTGEALSFTDFDYVVEEWVSAPAGVAMLPDAISIHQTGGIVNGRNVEVTGDPLLVPGERSVLFLRQYAPGQYFILGGPTGRLLRARSAPRVRRGSHRSHVSATTC